MLGAQSRLSKASGSGLVLDLESRTALLAALANAPSDWTPNRVQLLTRLLEDWRCQLTALHAEVLLRWSSDAPEIQKTESLGSLQPVLLRSALAQDVSPEGATLIGLVGPADAIQELIKSSSNTAGSSVEEQPSSQAWQQCALQLDVHALVAALHPAPQDKAALQSPQEGADAPVRLRQPLSEPNSQTGSERLFALRVAGLRELTNSPFSETRHTGPITPRPDRPMSGASSISGMSGPLQPLTSTSIRPVMSENYDDAAQWAGQGGLLRFVSPAPSTENSGSLSKVPLSRLSRYVYGGGEPASGGSSGIPEDRPITGAQPMSRLRLSQMAGGGGPATFGDWGGGAAGSGAALSSSYAPLPPAPPPAGDGGAGDSATAATQPIPERRHSGLVETEFLPAFSVGSHAAFDTGSVLGSSFAAGPGTLRQSSLYSATHMVRPSAHSTPGALQGDPRSPAAVPTPTTISAPQLLPSTQRPPHPEGTPPRQTVGGQAARGDTEQPASSMGGMDLDTALEAIINYEAGPEGQQVSAARAAAAHNTLQQHVAAAVRAAEQAAGGGPSGLRRAVGALGMNLAAARGQAVETAAAAAAAAAGAGPSGLVQLGIPTAAVSGAVASSAPAGSMAVLLQNRSDPHTAYLAGTTSHYPLQRSTSMYVDVGQRAAADSGLVSTPAMRLAMQPQVSISAPRPSSEWQYAYRDGPSSEPGIPAGYAMQQQQQAQLLQHAQSAGQQVVYLTTRAPAQAAQTVALGPQTAWIAVPQARAGSSVAEPESSFPASSLTQPNRTLWPRLNRQMRNEVQQMLSHVPNVKGENLDDPVLYQLLLGRRSDPEPATSHSAELPSPRLQRTLSMGGPSPNRCPLSRAILPTASKQALQRLPSRIVSRLEEAVARVDQLKWSHFDAGVIKVLCQLAEMSEADVLEELQLLETTDLTSVEYMPAYLNKRLNNRLWGRRKAQQP